VRLVICKLQSLYLFDFVLSPDKSRSSWQRLPSPTGVGVSPAARFPPPRPPRRCRCRARALFADDGGHPAAEHGGAHPAGLRRRAGGPRRVRPAGHWHRDAPGRRHLRDAHPRPRLLHRRLLRRSRGAPPRGACVLWKLPAISLSLSSCLNMQQHCWLIPFCSLPPFPRNWVW